MDSSISNGEVFPCDYEIFRKDRISDNPGGGIFIAIHNTILATHQPKLDSNSEAIWVKLEFVKQKPLYLASVYRPPGSQEGALNKLENSFFLSNPKDHVHVLYLHEISMYHSTRCRLFQM